LIAAVLIVAPRQSAGGVDCRACWRSAWPSLAFEGGAAPIAFDVHLKDGGVVDEAVYGGKRHGLVWKDLSPVAEGLVGGDEQGSPLVSGADEFEEDAGFRLILADIRKVVEDQEVVLVELGDGRLESKLAPGDLKLLHEVGGAREEHAPTVLDQSEAKGCRQVTLSAARRAEDDEIGALLEPAVAGGKRHELRLADHGNDVKVEGIEGLPDGQPGLGEVTFNAAATALGHLVLGERGEKAGGGPTLLVRLGGEIGPDELDGGKPQLGEEQLDPSGVDGIGGLHAAPP